MKKILLTGIFILSTFMLSAQLTLGTTGLLNSPSADMQPDKMVMLGGNFLHDRITPNGSCFCCSFTGADGKEIPSGSGFRVKRLVYAK